MPDHIEMCILIKNVGVFFALNKDCLFKYHMTKFKPVIHCVP